MTAASDGVLRTASDKTQCYEQLRTRILGARRAPVSVVSAVVLVRQGISAWMQLNDSQGVEHTQNDIARHSPSLPAPKHAELLTVLTSLVFNNLSNQKESA